MGESTTTNSTRWEQHLDGATNTSTQWPHLGSLPQTIKQILLEQHDSAARDMAHAIDQYYQQDYHAARPIILDLLDLGMRDYLRAVYELICDLARYVHYDDGKQDLLVQCIVELRALPPKPLTILGVRTRFISNHVLSRSFN